MRHGHENVDVVMNCDAGHCVQQVRRAPRMLVPSRTPCEPEHAPIRVMTTLHFCDRHRDRFDPAAYWTDRTKAMAEAIARKTRPADFRPDFERCRIEHVLVTTPEYRRFLKLLGFKRVVA